MFNVTMTKDSKLRELALGVIEGTVVISSMVPPGIFQMVFMPLVFMSKKQVDSIKKEVGKNGLLYGDIRRSFGRSIKSFWRFEYERIR